MTKNVKNYNAKVLIDDHLILEDPDQAIKEKLHMHVCKCT